MSRANLFLTLMSLIVSVLLTGCGNAPPLENVRPEDDPALQSDALAEPGQQKVSDPAL